MKCMVKREGWGSAVLGGGVLARFLSLLPCLGGAPSAAQHLSAEEDEGTTGLLGGASR